MLFEAKIIATPRNKERRTIGKFTIGKVYKVYHVYDSGQGFTDFLVADDRKAFYWIKMDVFKEV